MSHKKRSTALPVEETTSAEDAALMRELSLDDISSIGVCKDNDGCIYGSEHNDQEKNVTVAPLESSVVDAASLAYLKKSQFLPAAGLHAVHKSRISHLSVKATSSSLIRPIATGMRLGRLAAEHQDETDSSEWEQIGGSSCIYGCGKLCSDDCECKFLSAGIHLNVDAIRQKKLCCGLRKRTDSNKTITQARYYISASRASKKGRAQVRDGGDDDDEGGIMLLDVETKTAKLNPGKKTTSVTASRTGIEKFPDFDEDIACNYVSADLTMPIRAPITDDDYVIIEPRRRSQKVSATTVIPRRAVRFARCQSERFADTYGLE